MLFYFPPTLLVIYQTINPFTTGGVTLLRAAAKNHNRVTILSDPKDYPNFLTELKANGSVSEDTRKLLALKVSRFVDLINGLVS